MVKPNPDLEWIATLRENKREAFDGMRAYHASEINHANNAITALLAVAAAVGAAAVAMLFPDHPVAHVRAVAWWFFFGVLMLALVIAATTHIKISGDHVTYERFGDELFRTSKALGLYDSRGGAEPIKLGTMDKRDKQPGHGRGYRKTQGIVWTFALVLVLLTLLFAVGLPSIVDESPATPAPISAAP
jgi:hypothetical protein